MTDRIIGICRFFFLGQGDWIGMRRAAAASPDALAARQQELYAPDRMARRFAVFENLLLPSLRAQTDPDFEFWLLTSPELPPDWMDRLRALTADVAQIRILISSERATEAALEQPLSDAAAQAGSPVLQFRLDDDDAISRHFIARLRRHAARFADRDSYAISLSRGLILRRYGDEELSFWRAFQRFGSAGAAVKFADPGVSVFSLNHFTIPSHVPAFSDVAGCNYIQLRWDMGDSAAQARDNWDSRHQDIGLEGYFDALEKDFPFMLKSDLGFLLDDPTAD